jgi:NAD(P)-dependent dehydrogenase (short-subunit alcohol dehydrogenase family)
MDSNHDKVIRFNTVSPGVVNTPMHAGGNHAELAKFTPESDW